MIGVHCCHTLKTQQFFFFLFFLFFFLFFQKNALNIEKPYQEKQLDDIKSVYFFLKLHWCLNNRCLDIKSNEENAANNYKSLLECKSRSTRMKICSVGLYTISIKQLSLMFFMQVSIPKLLKIIKIVFKTNNESTEHCKEKKCL